MKEDEYFLSEPMVRLNSMKVFDSKGLPVFIEINLSDANWLNALSPTAIVFFFENPTQDGMVSFCNSLLIITLSPLSIMAIAKKLNLQISEETIPVSMIEQATEAFLCGTASEITVIKNIENRYFENSGEIVPKINSMYQRIIRGEESSFLSWLTVIK